MKRVLIIDDDAPLRRTYGRVLSAKFEVTSVASAEQGLEAVAALPPFDAILCDVCLGNGMSGQAFYSRLLEGYARQASRLVFLSGAPADGTRSGAPPHLLKACDLRELLDVVDHIANAA